MNQPPLTRREFGKLTLAGLPLSFAFQAIDSKVKGVQIGVQSYSFRGAKCYQFCRDALA